MLKKLIIPGFMLMALPLVMYSQARSAFSGDPSKFTQEMRAFMGPNLNGEQSATLNTFLTKWDSAGYSRENMTRILDISSQLSSRLLRPVPHFDSYLRTLNYFSDYNRDEKAFGTWLAGLSELAFSPRLTNDNIHQFLKNTASTLKENVIYESGSVRWKVKNDDLEFRHDTVFYIVLTDATLTCYSQNDSTEIYEVSGKYYPDLMLFRGSKGLITWEKAGFARNNVYASFKDFTINTSKSIFSIDSVRFVHSTYFDQPVMGILTDQPTSYSSREKATYPRFATYLAKFRIEDLYKDVDYEGGLAFEGANVKGTGSNFSPAGIKLYRNDTLYVKINSKEFIFTGTGINSLETSLTLYMDRDSIHHTNLGFSYLAGPRQVNLFRTNNPVSNSPYYNSFHNVDMYFEYLTWNMNEPRITLSRMRGSAMGRARFESSSFFISEYFLSLMGLDEYHPLNRLIKFSEWFYSETFPVPEFAKWLNKPVEAVTGMCIDMANKGFIFFDRINNEVTIKQKTKDFLQFFAKRKDYDVLAINSETKAPLDNASLDLRNKKLTINGVKSVFLSDSQMVAIYPYNQQLVLGRNRDITFNGVVQAGLFTIYGHDFRFSYDTFKIKLQKIDSIKIAVETGEKDQLGKPLIEDVDNLIQLGTAELYIDRPDNKSGLRSLNEYPIIDAITYSYIFYDRIPGLEGVYPQKDFYFRIDPFTYENIDHYSNKDMNLAGEFYAANILEPQRQVLTIQENNSLGFNMVVPEDGIEMYGKKAILYENLNMSSRGLIGSGRLNHLTSETRSEEFRFFPDSMITQATSFRINEDPQGIFPALNSEDVNIKWLTQTDEWLATNSTGKNFEMFGNGAALNGSINMTPSKLTGAGVIDMSESRITSNRFSFASNAIRADTADYNIKSRTTSGYSFIAENANTDINFTDKMARFTLNTDSSVVMFPEIQYICTMTDFAFNMDTRVLDMEQKGKSDSPLLNPDELLRVNRNNLDKPTFFSTNNMTDTVKFSSWKGSYHLDKEVIVAENINYIPVADALIQPGNGRITILRRADIQPFDNAVIALNNKHILHNARIDIESTKRYSGSAVYDYVDENKEIQQIIFPELMVDTLTTTARGSIPESQKFMLSPAFTFSGDVQLNARADHLTFTGSAGIVNDCDNITSYSVRFKSVIDPMNILIPVSEKPRDINDNLVFSGSFFNTDSMQIYPAFLSAQKSYADIPIVKANGFLYYDKSRNSYLISSLEKITDRAAAGNMIVLDRNQCILSGEGSLNFGAKYDLLKMAGAGNVKHIIDSGKVTLRALLALDFHFSPEALAMMADEIRLVPSLKPVNINSELNNKGMKDLFGESSAARIKEEMSLFGTSKNLPKEFTYELFINDVNLYWNEGSSSFRSTGKIGIGFIGSQPVNLYVDGFVEIQRRRSGDMIDIYLKANNGTWYYFSYIRGILMTQSSNSSYNTLIADMKANARKHPDSSTRVPYTYMIAVEDRLRLFLRRMETDIPNADEDFSVR